ncbi:MAG TPA: type II secretion system minor pseudopilin GspK [Rhodanobacteraceae bacterium]|nr:type II secretion system minor pseudopilin GspK [Rhodanobacteraceae bacterium]
MTGFPHRQNGVALLVALLTVALAVILIAGLLDRGELAFARTRNALRGAQATAYAQGMEAYAAEVLLKDLSENPGVDANTDLWALPLPPQQVPGGVISATMRDLNGCFNLNNLAPDLPDTAARAAWLDMFRTLLGVRGIDPELADAVVDWLDSDHDPRGNDGAEDTAYLALPVPFRAANRNFAHVSELRLVRGFDGPAYARLAPFVCALPSGSRLNINTASVPILQSLDPHIGQAIAERLWNDGHAQWTSVDELTTLLDRLGVTLAPMLVGQLGVASDYFIARGDITLDDVPLTYYSLIERRRGTGILVLERSRGSDDALTDVAPIAPESRR